MSDLPASQVRELANAGFGRGDVERFWFGEGHLPTPAFIRAAAIAALEAGDTFYEHNNGRAALRRAIATYLQARHVRHFEPDRVTVCSSGVSALALAMQAVLDPGDRAVVVTPVWPNLTGIPALLGAQVVRAPLTPADGRWRLDLDRLLETATPETRLLVINSPNNPTGWMLPEEDRAPILEHCRRHGIWLLVDDVYERLVFDPALDTAPSFLALAEPEDRLLGANSFSKTWSMTGWRLGWLVAPPQLEVDLGKLVELSTSCAPGFVQAAGIAALERGEPDVQELRHALTARRNELLPDLRRLPGVEAPTPQGAMYAFFRLAGHPDSVELARRLAAEAGLGLAPGAAFGPEGEGWLRWCLAAAPERLSSGLGRLARWLETHG